MDADELRASWRRHLRAEGKADRTVKLYDDAVRYLADWAGDRDLSRDTLLGYLEHSAATVSPGTALTRFKHLRAFTRWLHAEGDTDRDLMAGIKPPAVPETPVPVLSDVELTALLKAAAAHPDRFTARRDEALLRVLLDTGVRISELVGMTTAETDLDQAIAWVLGKGSRRRVVVLSPKTVRALDRYLKDRRQHRHAAEPALWLTQRGAASKDAADERLRDIARRAGVEGVHAHRFRHSWAHDWLAAGGSERDIMRLAGWRTATMLDRYGASMADVRAREAAARMRRGDRL